MTSERIVRSLAGGAASGLRTMTGPAAVFARRSGSRAWLWWAGALGEYIVDKLPATPPRTQPFGLVARAAAAGFAASSLAEDADERLTYAAFGIAAAIGTAFAGRAYRQAAARLNIPDLAAALLEDGIAIALAHAGGGRG